MSRFTSGGTIDEPTKRDEAWLAAEREIETKRREKEDAARLAREGGGKSLYETLEANKAAKQEAFEESIRLKNQFRTLDDDEIGFLDSVLESTRAKEAAVKRETATELERFRRERVERERLERERDHSGSAGTEGAVTNALDPSVAEVADVNWKTGGRKRRKLGGVVHGVRRSSESLDRMQGQGQSHSHSQGQTQGKSEAQEHVQETRDDTTGRRNVSEDVVGNGHVGAAGSHDEKSTDGPRSKNGPEKTSAIKTASTDAQTAPPKAGLGLDDYSSEDD